jgi:hypothetical protein
LKCNHGDAENAEVHKEENRNIFSVNLCVLGVSVVAFCLSFLAFPG